ncbi:MAG: hypothetical protein F6J93_21970 [Oscillatoria sp. SIO1A7]|nr:hypothetical protein [Oscillatoria sp. SIO1A7]
MKIEEWEGASAVWAGVEKSSKWLGGLVESSHPVLKAITGRLKTFNPFGMLNGIEGFAQDLWGKTGKALNAGKKGYKFLRGWFEDDPIGASAGIIAGGLAVPAIVSVGSSVGGLVAGGMAALGKAATAYKGAIAAGGVLGAIPTIKSLGGFLVEKKEVILNFDWNISDEDIKQRQEEYLKQFVEKSGGILGDALTSLVCSAHAGMSSVEIDYALLTKVHMFLDDESIKESKQALKDLSMFTKHTGLYLTFLHAFSNVRDWIQSVPTGIEKLDEAIESWGKDGSESWTFAEKIEEIKKVVIDSKTLAGLSLDYLDSLLAGCHDFSLTG